MLSLFNITKNYITGDSTVAALKGINVHFRKSEFVSVLGHSGCGKTTLLNIIGGLDRYTDGDLVINGRSTKDFSDGDWDNYRNHSIGFVFQSYNLIPHQTVLSNVELALTLSGVSREERRRRAVQALEKVGLGDQIHKKPNQMSGGQMQRVAIARALVNDPDILLADEPTGALDSETSVQIMDILKEISADKLIIMVTHNPDLAQQYSTRIIRLVDGLITDDSMPFDPDAEPEEPAPAQPKPKKQKKQKKPSMSIFTAISLSFNNLLAKKARTLLTSFAGSIGIIGIALIMSLSSGVNAYIESVQEDTMSTYPINIKSETIDTSAMLGTLASKKESDNQHELDKVYSNTVLYELMNTLNQMESHNNLRDFKVFLDKEMAKKGSTDLADHVTSIQYTYDLDMNIFTKDAGGKVIRSDVMALMTEIYGDMMSNPSATFMSQAFDSMNVWTEMIKGDDGQQVGQLLRSQFDIVGDGHWPEKYNEVVLVIDKNNEIDDICLYALGLKSADKIKEEMQLSADGKQVDITEKSWTYDELYGLEFSLVPSSDMYSPDTVNGGYASMEENESGLKYLYDNGIKLKISAIVRPNEDATSTMMSGGSIGYTAALTEYIASKASDSDIVKKQIADKETDIFTGKKFKPDTQPDDSQKAESMKKHIAELDVAGKAELYRQTVIKPDREYLDQAVSAATASMSREDKTAMLMQIMASQMNMDEKAISEYIGGLDDQTVDQYVAQAIEAQTSEQYAQRVLGQISGLTDEQAAAILDKELPDYSEEKLAGMYDSTLESSYSDSDYKSNLKKLGYVDLDDPFTINIFTDTFDKKDKIAEIINGYNEGKDEKDAITYTDIVKQLMSSVTTIINAISYILIAFVSISLIVSSLMIGIITYISVLERTKEIGVLRSIGASKNDISRVFNAETLIIGFTSGAIGIIVTLLLCIPINIIIHAVTDINAINAALPFLGGVLLMAVSIVFTLVAGIIPSRIAAKKDPVEALRTE